MARHGHAREGERPPRQTPFGVTTRLLALVLVPLLGLGVLSASVTRTRLRAAEDAAEIERDVDRIGRLLAVRVPLFHERVSQETVLAIRQTPFRLEDATAFVGYDIAQRAADTRVKVDAAAAALTDADRVVTLADLERMRSEAAAGTAGDNQTGPYRPLDKRLEQAVDARLAAIETRTASVPGAADLPAQLAVARAALNVADGLVAQMEALELLFLDVGDQGRHLRSLVAGQTAERLSLEQLEKAPAPELAAAVSSFRSSAEATAFDAYVEAIIGGTVRRLVVEADRGPFTDTVHHAQAYVNQLFALVSTATGSVKALATSLRTQSTDELGRWVAFVVVLGVAAVVVSLLLARSISRPLHRLADHAAAVSSGDLNVGKLGFRGPRDIAVTGQAFDDLVANLRLLESKTQALADLDLEAEVLAEPLPGRLGRSLERSAHTLSGSIVERDRLRDRLVQQATHDALTGLANRSVATDAVEAALARARRTGRGAAVVVVDLDDFKRTNDTHGQRFGDEVLRVAAARLQWAAEDATLVARLGSDQFLVLVEDVTEPDPVGRLGRRIADALGRPVQVAGMTVVVSASVGIAFTWDGTGLADQLLAGADLAVVRAKQRAPGSVELYDERLQEQLVEQAAVEADLRRGLEEDELFLQYQPVVHLPTGRLSSVEALVRWNRAGAGTQPPDAFIPVAERSNLIVDLDRWVLARAARQLGEWQARERGSALGTVDMAVNVSGRHVLSQTLHAHVVALLDATGIDPRRLVLEITETVLVNDLLMAAAQLEAVRRLGVRIALDDFGTGYASIAHLQQLPIDVIKIDRSFVARLDAGGGRDRGLLAMICELGHYLGVTITAEGVETVEQYEVLRELGCDRAQGYLLSRPLVPDDLARWVAERATAVRK